MSVMNENWFESCNSTDAAQQMSVLVYTSRLIHSIDGSLQAAHFLTWSLTPERNTAISAWINTRQVQISVIVVWGVPQG